MSFRRALCAVFLGFVFAFAALTAMAQNAGGVINGRVITEDGLPVSHAIVSLVGVSGRLNQTTVKRETVGDDDGNFQADGLEAIPYLISAWAPGYVPASDGVINPFEVSDERFVHLGELVTIKLRRGGVITGRVTNDAGEPVVGMPVKATRVRDESGRSTSVDVGYAHLWTRTTDDRGVYRIYGLAPGSYIVAAGGSDPSSSRSTPFAGRGTTYYPSSTRDAATLVNVSSGFEATGIDIRYRAERGVAISGKVHGAPGATSTILLRSPTNDETIETVWTNNQNGYAFYGVSNGEYEVIARSDGAASAPRRLTLKDTDVTGVDLTLIPYASITGVIVVETAESQASECKSRKSYAEEIIVRARRDDASERVRGYGIGIPYDKGGFTIPDLKPGRHHIDVELPDETWYLKTMTMTGVKAATDPRAGLTLKSADKLVGLKLTVASGAAMLKGKITPAERLRVHLIPAETEAIDDLLRYVETRADAEGGFTFTNLAPGKYFVLARATPNSQSLRPAAWDPAERQKLRKDAAAANVVIELKPCQRITDYTLRVAK